MPVHKTYKQYLDDYNNKKFMFSEVHGLMCSVQSNGEYYVRNGHWTGTRDGDEFLVNRTGETITVTDWREIRLGDYSPEFRECWYLPEEPKSEEEWEDHFEWEKELEDGIAF